MNLAMLFRFSPVFLLLLLAGGLVATMPAGVLAADARPLPYRYPDPVDDTGREWEARAIAALDAEDWPEVVRTATLALGHNNRAISALINRGVAYWYLGDMQKARADWQRATTLAPSCGEARYDHGLAWQAAGNDQRAQAEFRLACRAGITEACLAAGDEIAALSVDQLLDRTVTFFNQGDYAKALELSNAVLAREPANPEALTNRCGALVSLGRAAEAMDSCDRATQVAPEFGLAYNNLGAALEQQGELTAARVYYELACRRHTPLGCANRDRLDSAGP